MSLYTVPEIITKLEGMDFDDCQLADAQAVHEAAEALKRLSRPYSEREPPHCPTCSCGCSGEPQSGSTK